MSIRLKTALTFIGMLGGIIFSLAQPLASGQWIRFSVAKDGVYKIDYSLLKKVGINPDQIDPQKIQLFSNGTGMLPQANNVTRQNKLTEMAVFVQGEGDGKFNKEDYILFFGQSPDAHNFDPSRNIFTYEHNIYADRNFYFLNIGTAPGKRMNVSDNLPGNFPIVDRYNEFGYYETDRYNILKSGRKWFGEQFDAKTEITVRFVTPGIVAEAPVNFVSHVMAQAYDAGSSFKVFFNGTQILEQNIQQIPNTQYAEKGAEKIDTIVFPATSINAAAATNQDIKYQYIKAPSGTSIGYLDYFIFSYTRSLALYNDQTVFTSAASLSSPVSTFRIAAMPQNALIWDITDPLNIKNQSFVFADPQSSFSVASDILKTFVAFNPDKSPGPVFDILVPNQNLAAIAAPDLLIVTHPDLKDEASRLADFRQSHNHLTVQVVTTDEIYNEFSGGKQDVSAIRDFVREVYGKGGAGLDNVLLFGRCSYDYKNRVPANTNLVPTYESRNSLSPLETYSSDDYFGFLETGEGTWSEEPAIDHSMDIGVGRISVVTAKQAHDVVDKLIDYETNEQRFDAWRKNIVFVADDGDENIHQSQANQLADNLDSGHPEFDISKIYLDQFKQIKKPSGQFSPDAKDALQRAIEKGAVLVNYTGHGSEEVWAQEQILDQDLVEHFKNAPFYPLFVTATCEFGRHDDPFDISSGERLLLQPAGGAIGLVTTARPVYSSTNFELNKAFYNALFVQANGTYRDLGFIFRDTKNNSLSGVGNRNFSLIGDPSMHLAFAPDEILVNSVKTIFNSDTLKALSTVVLKGEVQQAGAIRTTFNGVVEVAVYDRASTFVTRGDENFPFSYTLWSNALFHGKATVTTGSFQAKFVVPADLEDDVASGKISLYAHSGGEDAVGVSFKKIGGRETSFPADDAPPVVQLFIGDTTFINGGVASPNTTLVVKLRDDHGIAITGLDASGSLTAILDDSLTFVLNAYYESEKDNYTQGKVLFPLLELAHGNHTIVVHASDTYGNRTSSSIDFAVTEGNLVISKFYNYPNPFLTEKSTTLAFAHNRPGEDLEVELTIMDMTGQVVDAKQFNVPSSLTVVTLTDWNGTNGTGNKLRSGIYLGKLFVRSLLDGSKNQQFTKLIIVN